MKIIAYMVPMANFSLFVAANGNTIRLKELINNWNWDFYSDFKLRKNKRALTFETWENSCQVEIQRIFEPQGIRFQYMIHEMLPGRVYTHMAKDLAPEFVDEAMSALIGEAMAYQLRSHEITPDLRRHACLVLEGDVEPMLYTHFDTEDDRNEFMKNYRQNNGDEDGIYFVTYTGQMKIEAPSGSFFEENR